MTITVNGERLAVTDCANIAALLGRLEIDSRRVAVERNMVIVKRTAYGTTPVEDGDAIEVVNFVGGG
jgi:thiamine biosynthesis protein ThiS